MLPPVLDEEHGALLQAMLAWFTQYVDTAMCVLDHEIVAVSIYENRKCLFWLWARKSRNHSEEKKAEVRSMRAARPPDNNTAMHQGSAPLVAVAN